MRFRTKQVLHVAGLVFKEENGKDYVLIGKRKKTEKLYPEYWEFGGGKVKKNETFEEALKRELWEEFNIEVKILMPFETYNIIFGDRILILGICFLCRLIKDNPIFNTKKEIKGKEHDIIKWVFIEDLVDNKQIYDFLIPGLKKRLIFGYKIYQKFFKSSKTI